MKPKALFILMISTHVLFAQTFTEVFPYPPFEGVEKSAIAIADVDGDKDDDVFITGLNKSKKYVAKLYINDGSGQFAETKNTPFVGVANGAVAFADVDGDNDQDLLITGNQMAKLYINDGSGQFTEKEDTPFIGLEYTSLAFADIDGDQDKDLLLAGQISPGHSTTRLYINDGTGQFTRNKETQFTGVVTGAVAFFDADGDQDNDLLITGQYRPMQLIAKLYINDGSGGFKEKEETPFEGVYGSSMIISDFDGDNDKDVIISGYKSLKPMLKWYVNDGAGQFRLKKDIPFEVMSHAILAVSDFDEDNNSEVLIVGNNTSNQPILKWYTGDGKGQFTEKEETAIEALRNATLAISDIDGDNDNDLFISGVNKLGKPEVKLYINDGSGNFSKTEYNHFVGVSESAIAFADLDGDNDNDLVVTGKGAGRTARYYINDGTGHFTEKRESALVNVERGVVAASDVDGDNDNDVVITGNRKAKLYINDGAGNFNEKETPSFWDVENYGSTAFVDVDGDKDNDLFITGRTASSRTSARLYTNDGSGNFEGAYVHFADVMLGSSAFADFDDDKDIDLIVSGDIGSRAITNLLINDGSGKFAKKKETPFEIVSLSSVACADVDGDKDNDLFITGSNQAEELSAKLYINDGAGNFSEVEETLFEGVSFGSVAFADVDGDNDVDLFITGRDSSKQPIAKLYINDGAAKFSELEGTPFEGVAFGAVAFADVDGDDDLDLFITGRDKSGQGFAKLYLNE